MLFYRAVSKETALFDREGARNGEFSLKMEGRVLVYTTEHL